MTQPRSPLLARAITVGACAYAIAWAAGAPIWAATLTALAIACLTWTLGHH